MPTTVYHGADGTISVAVESGPSGDAAKKVIDKYSLTPIGRATGVTVRVTNDVKPFHELGQRFATDLRPGNVNVFGTISRAYINGALLRLMLGDAADNRPAGTFVGKSTSRRFPRSAFVRFLSPVRNIVALVFVASTPTK